MTAERPAAGSTEYAASIEQIRRRTKKLFTAFAAAALCIALLWFSLGAADYVRVMNLHTRPLFCAAVEHDESGAYFRGMGYSFRTENALGGGEMISAEFYILGIEIKKQ